MSNTFVFQHGLLDALVDKFKAFLVIAPISFIILIIKSSYKITEILNDIKTVDTFKKNDFLGLYYTHQLCTVPYYVLCLYTAFVLGDPKLYHPKKWVNKH